MAVKAQEKKISQREAQLERKVTSLEEELHKTKAQLDREYLAQEAKKAKVRTTVYIHTVYIIINNALPISIDCGGTCTVGETKKVAANGRKTKRKT